MCLALAACGDGASQAVACGPVERPPLQGGSHLIGDADPPIDYTSTPGTSGYHAARVRTGVFGEDDALREPEIVSALEAGQVVVAYDPATLPEAEVREAGRLVRDRFPDEVTVTPFEDDMGAPLVLNAWGVRRPCEQFDIDTLTDFVDRFAGQTTTEDH